MLNTARIEDGIPWYDMETTTDRFPLETGLDSTVSTSKGCYLGQEPIIRILHRGHVNRALAQLVLDAGPAPDIGTSVVSDGREVGQVTSAALSPTYDAPIALTILRVDVSAPGTKLSVAGRVAVVRQHRES